MHDIMALQWRMFMQVTLTKKLQWHCSITNANTTSLE